MASRGARVRLGAVAVVLALAVVAVATRDRPDASRNDALPSASSARPGADTPRSTATSAPAPGVVDIELPPEFEPRESLVSPDAEYVAALARDRGTVRLYRLGALMPGTVTRALHQVAEVRGFVSYGDVSWLDDSSAILVRTDLVPGHTLQNRDPNPSYRVVLLNTDGRTVTAPPDVSVPLYTSHPQRRTPLSPDGGWILLNNDECCVSRVRLLSRDGLDVRTVVPAPSDGSTVTSMGWDGQGNLLYQQSWTDRSVLTALDATGSVAYRVSAPPEFRGAMWAPMAVASDGSWRLIRFGFGIGSSFREHRLLVGSQLRALPEELEEATRVGVFARGSELVYRTSTGAMRAYDVKKDVTRTLSLVVAPNAPPPGGPSFIGVLDRYFVWMELVRGFAGDLESGKTVPLELPSPPYADRLDGGFLAVYRASGIIVTDLAALLR